MNPIILNINDNAAQRLAMNRMLGKAGFQVREADGGRAGLKLAAEQPSLILLDVQMPDLNGYEVCRQLKAQPSTRTIPVIMISASFTTDQSKVQGLESGADSYLTWPIESTVLVASVNALLRMRKIEGELQQAHKLGAIGQLAGGLAHEINTPMQFICDNTRFVQDAFADWLRLHQQFVKLFRAQKTDTVTPALLAETEAAVQAANGDYLAQEIPKALAQSLEGAQRVTRLVRALADFAKPATSAKVPMDLNQLVETTLEVTSSEWKPVAEIARRMDPNLPLVPVLPGELNQALLHLVVNAAQAIAEVPRNGAKGLITVHTLRDGEWVELRIGDNGPGIPGSLRDKIFDPFFTTKPLGKSTGQGLATVWSVIVEQHQGKVGVESAEGQGATFILRLPLAMTSAADRTVAA